MKQGKERKKEGNREINKYRGKEVKKKVNEWIRMERKKQNKKEREKECLCVVGGKK